MAIKPGALEEDAVDRHEPLREGRRVVWKVSYLLVFGGSLVTNSFARGEKLADEEHGQQADGDWSEG
jgi:hypothetical protein